MRWDQEPSAKSPLHLQHREVAPHACLGHPYHLLHSQEVFGTSQGLPGHGITYRRAKSSYEAKCWSFPKGPGAFAVRNPPQRHTWNVQHLNESGREESKAWWEPRFCHLLPGRGWKLRDAGGLSTGCHRARQCQGWRDATSQAAARGLALYPQAGGSPLKEDVRWDEQGQWLQTAQQWAQPSFVPV